MKQILPELKQVNKHLNFAKKSFTKGGFRLASAYIGGLITLNKKSIRQISKVSVNKIDRSALNRLLTESKFDQNKLEKRYLRKIKYLAKGQDISLLFDDTLVKREGKHVEEAQSHHDHSSNGFIRGHQFFTAIIHTPFVQLPLFPKIYSKNTESKIDMAYTLVESMINELPLKTVLFDSWYSDKKIIKRCIAAGVKVLCAIKANRKISIIKGEWHKLSTFSKNVDRKEVQEYWIDEAKYEIWESETKLHKIPKIKLLISKEWDYKQKRWKDPFHLISTNKEDNPIQIIRQYRIRWFIETYHRDIKQNLGFAKLFLWKKEGIVRHTILVTIAYIVLKLFIFQSDMQMTIGEACAHIQDTEMDGFIRKIVEIEDRNQRIHYFEEVFIRKTAQV